MRTLRYTLLLSIVSGLLLARAEPPFISRHLIICLDGVNFSDFEAAQQTGQFGYLKPASQLISSFPSLTNPAMVEILRPAGAPLAAGYEDLYYDSSSNEIRGGIVGRLKGGFVNRSFRQLFDFHPSGLQSSVEYLLPPYTCSGAVRQDLRDGLKRFEKSTSPGFTLYIGPTDCAAHTGGPQSVRKLLRFIDRELDLLLKKTPELRISVFSDHGNAYGRYRRVDLAEALEEAGYEVGPEIDSEKDVVLPRFGLIGAATLHTRSTRALDVARLIGRLPEVHFASVKGDDSVQLFSQEGEARIESRSSLLTYLPGPADPLDLKGPASHSAAEWFDLTRDHLYPDAVNRVWEQSDEVIINRASVLVSFKRGFYEGSRLLDLFVSLSGTHGSLAREQSVGFIASSEGAIPGHIRGSNAWKYLE